MSTIEFNNLLTSHQDFLSDSPWALPGIGKTPMIWCRKRSSRPFATEQLQGRDHIKGWLYTIMRNIFINNYKRKRFPSTIVDQTKNQYFLNAARITTMTRSPR